MPADQGGGFLKDNQGRFVRSRLDEPALKALAQATGGSYAPLGAENQGLEVIYARALAPLAKHDLESRTEKVYVERYQWPLALCLACLLSSLLVGTRRRAPSTRRDGEGCERICRRFVRFPHSSRGWRSDGGVRRIRAPVARRRRPGAGLAWQCGIGLSARRFLDGAARLF